MVSTRYRGLTEGCEPLPDLIPSDYDSFDARFIYALSNLASMTTERTGSALPQLSVAERVLIHLSRIRVDRESDTAPRGICQEGISEAVGVLRSHVPRAVKDLISDGFLEEGKMHVREGDKRVKTYLITLRGLEKARQIEERMLSQVIPAKVQGTVVQGMTIGQLENAFHRRIDLLRLSGDGGYLDLDLVATTGVTDFSDSPKAVGFLDREEALEQMKRFLKSRAIILAVYGAKGIGTSCLVKHFIEMLDEWNILWISLTKHTTRAMLEERIAAFARLLKTKPEMFLDSTAGSNTLIVADGYFDVDEAVTEFFSNLSERSTGAKLIVTCRDSTPSYSRFYRKDHIDSGAVQEMTLKGLPEEEAKDLLGNPAVPDEAFRRIYVMSRGSPMILTMLRDRDEDGLRRNTTFTNEEIRFLLVEATTKEAERE